MDGSELRLKDKSVLIASPLVRWVQSLTHRLTQSGANVILLCDQVDFAQRFAGQISDSREINDRYGRCAAVPWNPATSKSARDAAGRAAECFGGLDMLVEANFNLTLGSFKDMESQNAPLEGLLLNHQRSFELMSSCLPFLVSKKRSRVVFVTPTSWQQIGCHPVQTSLRASLAAFAPALSEELKGQGCTVNCIDLGLTEEALLQAFPGSTTAQALTAAKAKNPNADLIDPERASDAVTLLLTGLSQGLSGHTLRL